MGRRPGSKNKPKIDKIKPVEDNILFHWNETIQKLKSMNEKNIHILGLCSDGNVHAGIDDFIKIYVILYIVIILSLLGRCLYVLLCGLWIFRY